MLGLRGGGGGDESIELGGECGQGPEWALLQQQQATDNSLLFQMLAKHQKLLMGQVTSIQAQVNRQLWVQVTQTLTPLKAEAMAPDTRHAVQLNIKVPKMTPPDDLEAFIHAVEHTAVATDWPKRYWVAVLLPCLIGPVQQAVDAQVACLQWLLPEAF